MIETAISVLQDVLGGASTTRIRLSNKMRLAHAALVIPPLLVSDNPSNWLPTPHVLLQGVETCITVKFRPSLTQHLDNSCLQELSLELHGLTVS